jgi:hypothetical protein
MVTEILGLTRGVDGAGVRVRVSGCGDIFEKSHEVSFVVASSFVSTVAQMSLCTSISEKMRACQMSAGLADAWRPHTGLCAIAKPPKPCAARIRNCWSHSERGAFGKGMIRRIRAWGGVFGKAVFRAPKDGTTSKLKDLLPRIARD